MGIQAFPELNPSRKTEKVSDAEHYVKQDCSYQGEALKVPTAF